MYSLKTGTASHVIDTPLGMEMTGYIGRMSPSTGVHDPLMIRCIAFDDGVTKFVLAMCDLLGLSDEVVRNIKVRVEEQTSLKSSAIVIGCIHTHSGPPSIHLENCGEMDALWIEKLSESVVDCISSSLDDMEPSFLTYKTGVCSAAYNRVAGESKEEQNRVDEQVSVLEIAREMNGKPHTMLMNYACHPVTLTDSNLLYSRDFPYYAELALRESLSPELNLIFATGCCGDLDPVHRGGFKEAESTGRILAESVLNIPAQMLSQVNFENATISIDTFCIKVPLEHAVADAELLQMMEEYESFIQEHSAEMGNGQPNINKKALKARANWAKKMLDASALGKQLDSVYADIKVVRIGKLVIVTLPFEVFNDIGLDIKEYYGFDNTMVIGYADGNFGYFPSEELYDRSAYEVKYSFIYYGYPGPVSKGASKIIKDIILK